MEFHQGDSIRFSLSGKGNINLDLIDFSVYIYPNQERCESKIIHFTKNDLASPSENNYRIEIAPKVTAKMSPGVYTLELLCKGSQNIIEKSKGIFRLSESVSKKEIL